MIGVTDMAERWLWISMLVCGSAFSIEGCAPGDGPSLAGSTSDGGSASAEDAAAPPEDAGLQEDAQSPGLDAGSDDAGDDDAPAPPGFGLMHTSAQLELAREHRSQPPWQGATEQLLVEAQAALARTPEPKEDFDIPFYYGDPEASQAAKEGLRQDAMAAYALALGYQLADEAAARDLYASKALEFLDAWAAVNKSVSGDDGDLVVIYTGIPLLYAADLVWGYEGWDATSRDAFVGWVSGVLQPSAEAIKDRANNWGDWGTLGVVASTALRADTASVLGEADRIRARIASEIAENGELPEENKRTNSGMWYTFFAMTAMTTAAHIVRNTTGQDLFGYVAPNGRSIELALDQEFFYAVHPEQWPYPLPDGLAGELWQLLYPCDDTIQLPTPGGWPGTLFEVMSDAYGVAEWESWVELYRPLHGYHGWIFSTLMRQSS